MTDRDIMQQALEALQGLADYRYTERVKATMSALRERLAQPEQKRPPNCGTGYCSCIECVMQPAPQPEQEPVDLSYQPDWKEEYQKAVDLHCLTLDELREKNVEIKRLKAMIESQDMVLVRSAARIVDLQTHIENLEGEDK